MQSVYNLITFFAFLSLNTAVTLTVRINFSYVIIIETCKFFVAVSILFLFYGLQLFYYIVKYVKGHCFVVTDSK